MVIERPPVAADIVDLLSKGEIRSIWAKGGDPPGIPGGIRETEEMARLLMDTRTEAALGRFLEGDPLPRSGGGHGRKKGDRETG